ncbi:MAG: hypothetical protein KatS3mg130_0835 [Candidatus Sumerlaea sp.]|nr:MAG: hypothetical protein KatS3mg130_0835 [Candidatus Sumerlaea sp.]
MRFLLERLKAFRRSARAFILRGAAADAQAAL